MARRPVLDLRASPGFTDWAQYARTLEARLRAFVSALNTRLDAIDTSVAALPGDPLTVAHRVVRASDVGATITIDFGAAQKYTLILDANVTNLVVIAPVLDADRATTLQLEIVQAGGGSKTIAAWTNVVFYASTTSFY